MKAIGIDLGTTNSVAAIDGNAGVPRVLLSRAGEETTPSIVSFSQKQKALLIGRAAWNNAETDPADTVFSIKRLMGRPFDDEHVGRVRKTYPYAVVPADNPDDRGVRVIVNGVRYTPEDISAMILRQIVEDAASALGEPVTHAVITVPAYFNEVQREATRTAGEKAGLVVKKIIDEPTAAAIAFGMDRTEEEHNLLVFDMGGGTLDVSLLYAYYRSFASMAIDGDMWLGGDDFDREIVDMIVEWSKRTYKVDPSDDKRFLMLARRQAERAKHDLTQAEEATLVIPGAFALPGGLPATVNMKMTRAAFEARISSYIERSMELVSRVLDGKGLKPTQVSAVLLVGGSTYIPLVRRSLEKIFGSGKVKDYVNPMNAVALGAAILAAQLEGNSCPKCETVNPYDAAACVSCGSHLQGLRTDAIELTEVTERSFGIGVVEQGQPDVYSVLIKAGTPYPLPEPKEDTFYTRGHKIVIPVYVGDDPVASRNEYLGLVEYELPPTIPVRTPVVVQFNYDRDRILKVRVKIEGTDVDYEVTPKRHAPDPGAAKAGKWRVAIQNAIASRRSMIEEYGEFMEPEQKRMLEDDMRRAQDALRDQDATTGHQALVKLQETTFSLEIASRLWLVDRLVYDVEPKTAQALAELSKNLRDAYRAKDAGQVNRLRRALDSAINSVLESLKLPTDGILPDLLERISVTERAGAPRS